MTVDNLHSDGDMATLAGEDGVLDVDVISQQFASDTTATGTTSISEALIFGDCEVGVPSTRTFSLTNHTTADVMKFAFEDNPNVKFVPALGHLQPGK